MWLIIYTLFMYGLSNIIAFGKPFNFIREYLYRNNKYKLHSSIYELITCMMCLPTWLGGILSVLNIFVFKSMFLTPAYYLFQDNLMNLNLISIITIIIIDMSFTSGVVWLIDRVETYLNK